MQWEYYTTFLQAEARLEETFLEQLKDWKEGIPPYTPESLIPRLNALGADGWELVHMEPVVVGRNADVLLQSDNANKWTSTYFCVFKRPVTI